MGPALTCYCCSPAVIWIAVFSETQRGTDVQLLTSFTCCWWVIRFSRYWIIMALKSLTLFTSNRSISFFIIFEILSNSSCPRSTLASHWKGITMFLECNKKFTYRYYAHDANGTADRKGYSSTYYICQLPLFNQINTERFASFMLDIHVKKWYMRCTICNKNQTKKFVYYLPSPTQLHSIKKSVTLND